MTTHPSPAATRNEAEVTSKKYYVLIKEESCVPERKVPHPQNMDGALDFVEEGIKCRPSGTSFIILSVGSDGDVWPEDGLEALTIYGNRRQKALARAQFKAIRAPKTKLTPADTGEGVLCTQCGVNITASDPECFPCARPRCPITWLRSPFPPTSPKE